MCDEWVVKTNCGAGCIWTGDQGLELADEDLLKLGVQMGLGFLDHDQVHWGPGAVKMLILAWCAARISTTI